MPITAIATDVQFTAIFRLLDEAGDAVSLQNAQGSMVSLTPLAAMEMFEHLHAARNTLRREAGLPEIATPDEGVLILAFLRLLREEPAADLRGVLRRWEGAASLVQMNRLEALPAPEPFQHIRCPACKVRPDPTGFTIFEEPSGHYSTCRACGLTHLTYLWDSEGQWKPTPLSGVVAPENELLPRREGWPDYRCPSCKAPNDIRGWRLDEADQAMKASCGHCGAVHTQREWGASVFVCDTANGDVAVEVAG